MKQIFKKIIKKVLPRGLINKIHDHNLIKFKIVHKNIKINNFKKIVFYNSSGALLVIEKFFKKYNYVVEHSNQISEESNLYLISNDNIKLETLPEHFIYIILPNDHLSKKKLKICKKADAIIGQTKTTFLKLSKNILLYKSLYMNIIDVDCNEDASNNFCIKGKDQNEYYFLRFLFYCNGIKFDELIKYCSKLKLQNKICLSLPECVKRASSFYKENKFNFDLFPGLKFPEPYIGCGLSYKLISTSLLQNKHAINIICEDDIKFDEKFKIKIDTIIKNMRKYNIDIVYGFTIIFDEEINIEKTISFPTFKLMQIKNLLTTALNIYNNEALKRLSKWDPESKYTIDYYLTTLKINSFVCYPYLVNTKDNLDSAISYRGNNKLLYGDAVKNTKFKIDSALNKF